MTEMMRFEKNRWFAKKYNNVWTRADIGGGHYHFRSKAECKLALFLQLLKDTKQIKDWFYENHKFIFPDDAWLVDFTIRNNDDTFEYYEYKGHVEPKTKKLLKLLAKYRPEVNLTMIFGSTKDMKRLGVRATACCRRVCTLSELTRGIF